MGTEQKPFPNLWMSISQINQTTEALKQLDHDSSFGRWESYLIILRNALSAMQSR